MEKKPCTDQATEPPHSLLDFNQPMGLHMNPGNRWVKMADSMSSKPNTSADSPAGQGMWRSSCAWIWSNSSSKQSPVLRQGVCGADCWKPIPTVLHRANLLLGGSAFRCQHTGTVPQANHHGDGYGGERVRPFQEGMLRGHDQTPLWILQSVAVELL